MAFDQRDREQILADALKIERQTVAYYREELTKARLQIATLIREINRYRNILDIHSIQKIKVN